MNKKLIWGIIVVVIIAGGWYAYSKVLCACGKQPANEGIKITGEFNIYDLGNLGSFEYPSTWKKIQDKSANMYGDYTEIYVDNYPAENPDAVIMIPGGSIDKVKNNDAMYRDAVFSTTTINGIQWQKLKFGYPTNGKTTYSSVYLSENNGMVYEISGPEKVTEQIVSNFKFTSSNNLESHPSMLLLSPNGGEKFKIGDEMIIKWKLNSNIKAKEPSSIFIWAPNDYHYWIGTIDWNSNPQSFAWKVSDSSIDGNKIPMGKYKVGLNYKYNDPVTGEAITISDISDDDFIINN